MLGFVVADAVLPQEQHKGPPSFTSEGIFIATPFSCSGPNSVNCFQYYFWKSLHKVFSGLGSCEVPCVGGTRTRPELSRWTLLALQLLIGMRKYLQRSCAWLSNHAGYCQCWCCGTRWPGSTSRNWGCNSWILISLYQLLCQNFLNLCPLPPTSPLNLTGWFAKPKPDPLPAPKQPSGKRLKVLHVSDLHLDASTALEFALHIQPAHILWL